MRWSNAATGFALVLTVLACSRAVDAAGKSTKCSSEVSSAMQTRLVTTQNDLGFTVLHSSTGKNVFISPLSIAQALGVAYLGARGATAKAFIESSVVPPGDPSDFACASQLLRTGLPPTDSNATLEFANALWVSQGLSLKASFVEQAQAAFGADVTPLDFGSPSASRTINAWVSRRTHGHIPTIVNGVAGAEAIITNAVYFKALWEQAFLASQTSAGHFFGNAGTTSVPFLNQTTTLSYYASPDFTLVRLGYRGGRFAMYVVLPKQGTGLAMESELPNAFATALANATQRRVSLHLPKLHLAYEADLISPLKDAGLGIAFSDRADFGGISGRPLRISSVIHKTTLDVDEAGTTATAATAVVMPMSIAFGGTPIVVNVDHPFFCIIRDDRSGAVLFLGAISDVL
jgi:serine protease inhibitor